MAASIIPNLKFGTKSTLNPVGSASRQSGCCLRKCLISASRLSGGAGCATTDPETLGSSGAGGKTAGSETSDSAMSAPPASEKAGSAGLDVGAAAVKTTDSEASGSAGTSAKTSASETTAPAGSDGAAS